MTDVEQLRRSLASVERGATDLPWAKERPWRAETHVWVEGGLPVVDLHDLGTKLADKAVRRAAAVSADLQAGAVCFVTGRGRRSIGPGVVRRVTEEALRAHCAERGCYYRPAGPGRLVLVVDPSRAPVSATGRLGIGFWLVVALFLVAVFVVCWLG